MKVIAIVQARMGSTRMPGKVMKSIVGMPMIELLLKRLSQSKLIENVILATSASSLDIPLAEHVEQLGYFCTRGSEVDVLDRFYKTAKEFNADVVVRITGDCPLVDPQIVDEMIMKFKSSNVDYLSNIDPPTFPDGLDVEVFSSSALERAWIESSTQFDREHVTPFLRRAKLFRVAVHLNDVDNSQMRWTVDHLEDLSVVEKIFSYFSPDIYFTWKQVMELHEKRPDMFVENSGIARNEGSTSGTGQKLWKRAKNIIPGGNMLLSKRPEMFLPEKWPSYFSKAQGCFVWDLDGNKYIDMSIMGVGTNILGYGHPEVDDAVKGAINLGNMATLNCPEEVYLAEKLLAIHPWADMVRFARTGGEANAIAIRIARAASGRDKVAVCGYHGWHDWYLSANLGNDESLAGHLLPGLDPKGVPRNLRDTVFPFEYNNFKQLEEIVSCNDIGVIKMEVVRNHEPENNFLRDVRKLATAKGIVLIFDECTSGFRQTFGGLHKYYEVEPDMAIFGKALGNGYAITAIIGRLEIMEAAQSTFISSTFWTERIGPTAAIKTLEIMERVESWNTITKTGLMIRNYWQQLAESLDLKIDHWGLPALTGFSFRSDNALAYKTYITQEMLSLGYLAGNSIYVSTAHTSDIVEGYMNALTPLFATIKECEEGRAIMPLLKGPICHGGFKRLN